MKSELARTLARTLTTDDPRKRSEPAGALTASLIVQGVQGFKLEGLDAEASPTDVRKAIVAASAAGEPVALLVDAVTFIQRKTPNRNFVRFARGGLRALAKTYEGQPVLLNHDWDRVEARIGTITKSRAELVGEGDAREVHFVMKLRIVRADAALMFVDGLLDRFSIGWNRTGPVTCSLDGKPLWGPGCCMHWPGEADQDTGAICEAVIASADGVEVSPVNVPAVVGTHIDEIRAALSAHRNEPPRENKTTMDPKLIRSMLGLAETATDAEVLAEIERRNRESETLRASSSTSAIAAAIADGRLQNGRDAAGNAVDTPFVTYLRTLGKEKPDELVKLLDAMPRNVPPTQARPPSPGGPSPAPDPAPPATGLAAAFDYKANKSVPSAATRFGLTMKEVEAYGPHNRLAQDGPVPGHLVNVFRSRHFDPRALDNQVPDADE